MNKRLARDRRTRRNNIHKSNRLKKTQEEVSVKYEREQKVNENGNSGSRLTPYSCDIEDHHISEHPGHTRMMREAGELGSSGSWSKCMVAGSTGGLLTRIVAGSEGRDPD